MTTPIRQRKKFIETDSPTPKVKETVVNRINKQGTIKRICAIVGHETQYTFEIKAEWLQDQMAREGMTIPLQHVRDIMLSLSGNGNQLRLLPKHRENILIRRKVRNKNKYRYFVNPEGVLRIAKAAQQVRKTQIKTARFVTNRTRS